MHEFAKMLLMTQVHNPLLELNLSLDDFEAETGQTEPRFGYDWVGN